MMESNSALKKAGVKLKAQSLVWMMAEQMRRASMMESNSALTKAGVKSKERNLALAKAEMNLKAQN